MDDFEIQSIFGYTHFMPAAPVAPAPATSPDPRPLVDRMLDDVGGTFTVGLAYVGQKLGLFARLADVGPVTSVALAAGAGLDERYVREWLNGMVAASYVEHDPAAATYWLTGEQRAALVDEGARTFAAGMWALAVPSLALAPRLIELFREGGGIPFGELSPEIPEAIDRQHRPWFDHMLVQEWLPGAPGLVAALQHGVSVLDVGCGRGRSTLALARAYPQSTFVGIDPHPPSIEAARDVAGTAGLGNARFATCAVEALAAAQGTGDVPPGPFDVIIAIDCVHDMVDPVGGLRAIGELLSPGGAVFWAEPTGSRNPLQNRNPAGKLRATLSPFHCLTVSLAAGGAGLGTIIGEEGARELAAAARFGSFTKLAVQNKMQQFFLLRR